MKLTPEREKMILQYIEDCKVSDKPWEKWEWEVACGEYGESTWRTCTSNLNIFSDIKYRRKTEKKLVDMSVFIGSGILCSFWDSPPQGYIIHNLAKIKNGNYYYGTKGFAKRYCKPLMNYWFSELNYENIGLLKYRIEEAGFKIEHAHNNGNAPFQILGLQEGYCWPWDIEV